MKAVLELELIGDDAYEALRHVERTLGHQPELHLYIRMLTESKGGFRPWVARLTGLDPQYGYRREFVRFNHRDYSRANSVGSRGVYASYLLGPGIYEVCARVSWKRTRRYFLRVLDDGSKKGITESEVRECLVNILLD